MDDCKDCSSFSKSHFCDLTKNHIDLVDKTKSHLFFKKGQIIFSELEPAQGIYCITKGVVRLNHVDQSGKETILKLYEPGNILGYGSFFQPYAYRGTAIAYDDCEICYIPEDTIKKLLKSSPELTANFLKQIIGELYKTEERMRSFVAKSVQSRVAEALIYFNDKVPNTKWTRKDLADWMGTTPESVMRTLSAFEDQSLISQEGRLVKLLNKEALSEIAQQD